MEKKQIPVWEVVLCAGLLITACGQQSKTVQPDNETTTAVESSAVPIGEQARDSPSGPATLLPENVETVEYEGEYYLKSDISEDTLKWLEFYHSMPEEERLKINMVPSEFIRPGGSTMETRVVSDASAETGLIPTSPPTLTLTDLLSNTLNEFSMQSGNYHWTTLIKGEAQEVIACGSHPLDTVLDNHQDHLKVPDYNKIDAVPYYIGCEIPPDTITVTMWDASSQGSMETKAESVTACQDETSIELLPGKVYELSAEWSKEKLDKQGFAGTASYVVVTE